MVDYFLIWESKSSENTNMYAICPFKHLSSPLGAKAPDCQGQNNLLDLNNFATIPLWSTLDSLKRSGVGRSGCNFLIASHVHHKNPYEVRTCTCGHRLPSPLWTRCPKHRLWSKSFRKSSIFQEQNVWQLFILIWIFS